MEIIEQYFTHLDKTQKQQYAQLGAIYADWNSKINLISRKDVENFYERHVLHSLAIAKVITFQPGDKVFDIGTGGGFPGIPLAILFPETHFILSDSIAKKIGVVDDVVKQLGLNNVTTLIGRAEDYKLPVDYVVTRAVAKMSDLIFWSKFKHPKKIIALKGGDLKDELDGIKKNIKIIAINDFFNLDFFETKKVVICS